MATVIAFFAGVVLGVVVISLLRASSNADSLASAYWEGYERGREESCPPRDSL